MWYEDNVNDLDLNCPMTSVPPPAPKRRRLPDENRGAASVITGFIQQKKSSHFNPSLHLNLPVDKALGATASVANATDIPEMIWASAITGFLGFMRSVCTLRKVCSALNTVLTPVVAMRRLPIRVPEDFISLQSAVKAVCELETQRKCPCAASKFDNAENFKLEGPPLTPDIIIGKGKHHIRGLYCELNAPIVISGEGASETCLSAGFFVGTSYQNHSDDLPIVVSDLAIVNAPRCGVWCDGAHPLTLVRCVIENARGHGIGSGGSGWVNAVDCTVKNSGCLHSRFHAVSANEFSTIVLRRTCIQQDMPCSKVGLKANGEHAHIRVLRTYPRNALSGACHLIGSGISDGAWPVHGFQHKFKGNVTLCNHLYSTTQTLLTSES